MGTQAKAKCGCWAAITRGIGGVCVSSAATAASSSTIPRTSLVHDAATEARYLNASNREMSTPHEPMLSEENDDKQISSNRSAGELLQFSFQELKIATGNFRPDSILGEGGFGYVFKGWVEENSTTPAKPGTGVTVAVKSLKPDALQGHREWVAEIDFLGQLHHPNLVKLIGYCIEDDQRLLVYEFMARGSLENHLFRRALPLPWSHRIKIAIGAAKGLAFLHGGAKPVIYRDFKTSNILLDSNYNAKLSDFGLAKAGPQEIIPMFRLEWLERMVMLHQRHLTSKSDVYSFGVVLLEILTGRRSVDKKRPNQEQNLVAWARPYLGDKRRLFHLVDPRLELNYSIKGVQKVAQIAFYCLNRDSKVRPSMEEIVKNLVPLQDLNDLAYHSLRSRTYQRAQPQRNKQPNAQ
ncbi:hypothetical protein HPP92_016390 [Vanilla planifolia]|uniref:non-specific serine/threonine protein kinase n=1 Tax=Vanilla planifolia TaxID=51239 RepID=A0A835QG02_VANPL|nr:hypothetical protein HPP92_016390 [Vanilla planifolia]